MISIGSLFLAYDDRTINMLLDYTWDGVGRSGWRGSLVQSFVQEGMVDEGSINL